MTSHAKECSGCGNEHPEYVTSCRYCGSDKCDICDAGNDVNCGNCDSEEDND